jgi:glycosyltransferase involved in cell wall biosynthesis
MGVVADLIVSPTESYDCLICTSSAVREAIETQMDAVRDYLAYQFGPRRAPELQRTTIPLGVNVDDFATSEASRKAWRETLDIPEDAVVALYVGRFNLYGKMNPALMALALEAAAQKTDKPIYWVNSGWGDSKADEATYHDGARALCPSVQYRAIDGREPGTRFSIWSVGDFFISFSDNIQETFGLTPVEAMAAGLPCVVTDWDGYKDTVRHGLDGFRVPTIAPRPGQGYDLAFRYSNSWISYDNYVGGASQFTAIDYAEAAAAIGALVNNPDYRRKLGAQAKAHARAMFDWAAIIPQYQALWGELNARRLAAPPPEARSATIEENPWRLDPFRLFANYPTEHLTPQTVVRLAPGMTWALAQPLLTGPLATVSTYTHPTTAEVEQIVAFLGARALASVEEVMAAFPAARRYFLERSLLWLARFGVLLIEPGERSIV